MTPVLESCYSFLFRKNNGSSRISILSRNSNSTLRKIKREHLVFNFELKSHNTGEIK